MNILFFKKCHIKKITNDQITCDQTLLSDVSTIKIILKLPQSIYRKPSLDTGENWFQKPNRIKIYNSVSKKFGMLCAKLINRMK